MTGTCEVCGHEGEVKETYTLLWCVDYDACLQRQLAAATNQSDKAALQEIINNWSNWRMNNENKRTD